MLIVITSDIHDNLANLDKCLNWCRKQDVEKMIFCGDLTTKETGHYLAANFAGEIFLVRGNLEIYRPGDLDDIPNLRNQGEIGFLELTNLNIGLCHESFKIARVFKKAAEQEARPDFIFYGHTHKPWLEKRNETTIVNPGNLANTFYAPTFAVLNTETKKLDLKILAEI